VLGDDQKAPLFVDANEDRTGKYRFPPSVLDFFDVDTP
jgi:hypothetical protein